jgi:hypothetical protein
MKKIKASTLDKKFDEGKEDILHHFDHAKTHKINLQPKRVNVDFPAWMVGSLDREADRLGVTRQSLIKMWLSERLSQTTS